MLRRLVVFFFSLGTITVHPMSFAAPEWQEPTPAELSMTADPAAPGAAAVILNMEENDDDNLKMQEIYVRKKILTEAAKRTPMLRLVTSVGRIRSARLQGGRSTATARLSHLPRSLSIS